MRKLTHQVSILNSSENLHFDDYKMEYCLCYFCGSAFKRNIKDFPKLSTIGENSHEIYGSLGNHEMLSKTLPPSGFYSCRHFSFSQTSTRVSIITGWKLEKCLKQSQESKTDQISCSLALEGRLR